MLISVPRHARCTYTCQNESYHIIIALSVRGGRGWRVFGRVRFWAPNNIQRTELTRGWRGSNKSCKQFILKGRNLYRKKYVLHGYETLLYYCSPNVRLSSSHVASRPTPCCHRSVPLIGRASPPATNDFSVLKPQATHLARPPAVYCVTE